MCVPVATLNICTGASPLAAPPLRWSETRNLRWKIAPPGRIADHRHTVGIAVPCADILVVDGDGREVPIGETGEICVRAPQVMDGYWQRPEQTAEALANNWLHTGDMAAADERGYLYIVDRKKDMIVVSGYNVYPIELENVIMRHPQVADCAVIGVPDDYHGRHPQNVEHPRRRSRQGHREHPARP